MYRFRQLIVLAGISTSLVWPAMAMDEELFPKPAPVPPEIMARIEALLKSFTPGVHGTVSEYRRHNYSWRCMDYLIHNEGMNYRLAHKSSKRNGPAADGYRLQLVRRTDPGTKRASGSFGELYSLKYWKLYRNFYELPDEEGYIELIWECGPLTDKAILNGAREILSESGSEVYDPAYHLRWKKKRPRTSGTVERNFERAFG